MRNLKIALALVVAGCGGKAGQSAGPDGGSTPDTGSDTGSANPDTGVAPNTASIGPAGGKVTGSSGASVTIPANALAADTTIGVAAAASAMAGMPSLPATVKPAGDFLAVTPHGQTFAVPVTVHVPYDATLAQAAGTRPLSLYTAEPQGSFTAVAGARMVAGALEADVSQFSFFVVGFETPGQTLTEIQGRKLDLLFMVDNSTSMEPLQQQLLTNFPVLMQTLKNLPGGLPDIHIGVVSSDLGAGQETAIPQCVPGGDKGILQNTPRVAGCQGPSDAFIAASEGETTKNYPGTIEDAFSCIAALGQTGCGYEHQLESVAVALGLRGSAPVENAGFLRADAALGVVLITNEDDCSASPDTQLFSTTSTMVADQLGPESSYRCNEFGHLCDGQRPPRTGHVAGDTVMLNNCHSAEDGVLYKVADYVQMFKSLKSDPGQVFISAITGPPTPYGVEWVNPLISTDPSAWPEVQHSCTLNSGEFADPAVRISDLLAAFGANGSMSTICSASFAPALTDIGAALGHKFGPLCLQSALADNSATPPALIAGCHVLESVPSTGGARTETQLPLCAPGNPVPCYALAADATCTTDTGGPAISVTRTDTTPTGAALVVRCQ
jgi:hypothetical protein